MQNVRPQHIAATVLERFYAENYESTAPWPYDMTMLAISLSGNRDHRMDSMAAQAILSQEPLVQDAILEKYEISYPIREAVEAGTFDEIVPVPTPTFDGYLGLTESVERAMMERRVDIERDRRIDSEFTFNGVVYQSRSEDRENLSGAATSALAAMVNGAQPGDLRWHGGDSDFEWIAADNSTIPMDAQTMFTLGKTALAHKSGHIFAARALKNADPIPEDYADDKHWPGYVEPEVEEEAA